MFGIRHRRGVVRAAAVVTAALLAAGLAACSNGGAPPGASSSPSSTKSSGGTVTEALAADVQPNWILPFSTITTASTYNGQLQTPMYRPLYMFGNNGNSVNINIPLSTANAPVYTDGGKTVTITMKGWKWSNGESVDAQDVIFWLNLLEAEKSNYYGYAPGLMPDNVTSYSATGPDTVVMHLNKGYSSLWYTYNQLAEITPFPASWDITKSGAAPGSGDCVTDSAADKWAKCMAVYNYLNGQAKTAATYATNPLWQVSDGPFKLSYFNTNGNVTFVPNPDYSGSPKPSISAFKFVPYTSDSTEYTALKTGQLDIGYIPSQDLPQKPVAQPLPSSDPLGSGYTLVPGYNDMISFYQENFNNPTIGAVFKQLYVREALQETVDQNGIDEAIWRGYAYPTAGVIPSEPKSQWIPTIQSQNGGQGPYPFSIAHAKSLLTSHGWTDEGGTDVCTKAGTASDECGAGIASGTKLAFTLDYSTGTAAFAQESSVYKSDAAQAGIQVSIVGQSFDTIIGESTPCSGPKCNWGALMYGGWVYDGPGYEPTGEPLFQTGAGSNSGSYSNPTVDSLIGQTHTSSSLSVFDQYATYTTQQAPYVWMPQYYNVYAVNSSLKGFAYNPVSETFPEYWYFSK
ncbi:MAG TPA: ABC transporter substrate-binding protein [Trebonia sp.]|jgi:peptide/nickel transport system substrate-binding protein|nr:ABC transporter substrate-binding protein [Trebonia sp.]